MKSPILSQKTLTQRAQRRTLLFFVGRASARRRALLIRNNLV